MKPELDEKLICDLYVNTNIGIETLAMQYHVGKKRIKQILEYNNIEIKHRGGQNSEVTFVINDPTIIKYENTVDYHYIVIDKFTSFKSKDIKNKGGILTTYIKKQYNVEIPSLYERNQYYKKTGNYWWEQYLTYVKVVNPKQKKCPFCNWSTTDIENKSGCFEQHLMKYHNYSKIDYLTIYPHEKDFFITSSLIKTFNMKKTKLNSSLVKYVVRKCHVSPQLI